MSANESKQHNPDAQLGGINQQTLTDLVTAEDSKSFRRNLNTVMEESKPRVDDGRTKSLDLAGDQINIDIGHTKHSVSNAGL